MNQRIVLGLGSNLGNRATWLRKAVRALKALPHSKLKLLKQSAIYQSEALLPENAPRDWDCHYLNLCLLCETPLDPKALLAVLKDTEKKTGRTQTQHWGPREIDIDLLAFGNHALSTEELTVPHVGLLQRPFAALPFRDVWPDWVHPITGQSMQAFCQKWPVWADEAGPFETQKTPLILNEMVGILNLTPDSFSDGGRYDTLEKAVEQFELLCQQGASIIDIGAESTRPGATPLTAEQEWQRLHNFLEEVSIKYSGRSDRPLLSLDTLHPKVAAKGVSLGIDCLNDVNGFQSDAMISLARETGKKIVLMHSLSIPPNKNITLDSTCDPVSALLEWGKKRVNQLLEAGLTTDQIIFDPGIGFGKTQRQSIAIIEEVHRLHELGLPLFVGHSRKSFLAKWFDRPAHDRDPETAVFSQYLAKQGVEYIRIHNVEANKRAIETQMLLKNALVHFA